MAPCYRSAEALATDGGLVVAKDLPDSAGGVKAFGQEEGSEEEEETGNSVNGVLEIVDPMKEGQVQEGGERQGPHQRPPREPSSSLVLLRGMP